MHAGVRVEGVIYFMTVEIENTGRYDVVDQHFVDPVKVYVPKNVDLLSIEMESDRIFGAQARVAGNAAEITWKILKPSEKFSVRLIVSAKVDGINVESLEDDTELVVRLRDVQIGEGWFRRHPNHVFAIAIAIAALIIPFPLYVQSLHKQVDNLSYQDGGVKRAISSENGGVIGCVLYNSVVLISSCKKISQKELKIITSTLKWSDGYTGSPIYLAIAMGSISIVYLLLAGYLAFFRPQVGVLPAAMSRILFGRSKATRRHRGKSDRSNRS